MSSMEKYGIHQKSGKRTLSLKLSDTFCSLHLFNCDIYLNRFSKIELRNNWNPYLTAASELFRQSYYESDVIIIVDRKCKEQIFKYEIKWWNSSNLSNQCFDNSMAYQQWLILWS